MDNIFSKIGFMQGRLSPLVNGNIQAFPWQYWQDEFIDAEANNLSIMEWTLDHEHIYENPLMTTRGQNMIKVLQHKHNIYIPSLTGDCFMQNPFYKFCGTKRNRLLQDLKNIISACSRLQVTNVLIPLVDNGRPETEEQEKDIILTLNRFIPLLKKHKVILSFESDFPPAKLTEFISHFDPGFFSITYDIGNSAALGYQSGAEIKAYGHRISNVHIKDRLSNGPSVPLGKGNADIAATLKLLLESGYKGNFILQTARSTSGDHVGTICHSRDFVVSCIAS